MSNNSFISPEDLNIGYTLAADDDSNDESLPDTFNLRKIRSSIEKRTIKRALKESDGNISNAAKLLEITRPTLYSMCEKLGIDIQS
jgi:two-component system NtrC family response regulator